jgi:hypothetical protein
MWSVGGDIPNDARQQITLALNRLADQVETRLGELGLPRAAWYHRRPRLTTRLTFELAGITNPGRRLCEITMPFLFLRE